MLFSQEQLRKELLGQHIQSRLNKIVLYQSVTHAKYILFSYILFYESILEMRISDKNEV